MIEILSGTHKTPAGLLLSGWHLFRDGQWIGVYNTRNRAQREAPWI